MRCFCTSKTRICQILSYMAYPLHSCILGSCIQMRQQLEVKDCRIINQKRRENDHCIIFTQSKKRNEIFVYNVPTIYWDMCNIYQGQTCKKAVENGKIQYIKNWNLKGKSQIQNMGKNTVNKRHAIACEILKKDPKPCMSHT